MAVDYTTTTTLAEIVPEITAEAILILQQEAGILETLRIKNTSGQPGLVTEFPTFTEVESSDVETPGEKTATTNVVDLETNSHQATVIENVVTARISDLALKYTLDDIIERASVAFASAIKAKLEDTVVGLFSGFSQTVAGAGITLDESHIFEAMTYLYSAKAPMNELFAVVSPKQFWGAKGLRAIVTDADALSGNLGEQFKNKGFLSDAFGFKWLVSNEINEDVAAGGDAAGAFYAKGALGLHIKNLVLIETARGNAGAEARYTSFVCTGEFGVTEIVDNWGVYCLSDVA
jgi:hypothetical protein